MTSPINTRRLFRGGVCFGCPQALSWFKDGPLSWGLRKVLYREGKGDNDWPLNPPLSLPSRSVERFVRVARHMEYPADWVDTSKTTWIDRPKSLAVILLLLLLLNYWNCYSCVVLETKERWLESEGIWQQWCQVSRLLSPSIERWGFIISQLSVWVCVCGRNRKLTRFYNCWPIQWWMMMRLCCPAGPGQQ